MFIHTEFAPVKLTHICIFIPAFFLSFSSFGYCCCLAYRRERYMPMYFGISNIFCGFGCIVVECKQCMRVRAVCTFVIFMLPVIKLRIVQLEHMLNALCIVNTSLMHTYTCAHTYKMCIVLKRRTFAIQQI